MNFVPYVPYVANCRFRIMCYNYLSSFLLALCVPEVVKLQLDAKVFAF